MFQKVAVEIEDTSSESEMEDVTDTVRQPTVKSGGKGKKGKDAEKTVKKTASEKKKAKADSSIYLVKYLPRAHMIAMLDENKL